MTILDVIPFDIDPDTVFARLHLSPHGDYAGEVHAVIDSSRRLARPRVAYAVATVEPLQGDAVVLAHRDDHARRARFDSRVLRTNLAGVQQVFPYVATCGRELESMALRRGDIFGEFCRDTVKEMLLWTALSYLYEHLSDIHGPQRLASMNPGSGEASVWPIEQQVPLFELLGNVEAAIGVTLTASCLMIPNKSVSGILYPSDDGFESCQLCRQESCPERRAPFDADLWTRMFD